MSSVGSWFALILFVVGGSQPLFQFVVVTRAQQQGTPSEPHHPTVGTLPLVLASWERVDKLKDKMEAEQQLSGADRQQDSYEFIVVGAGTAGSIVAARLAEHFSVLLLEAGGQPHPNHENPATAMIMVKNRQTDWMYSTVAQNETCLLCPNQKYTLSAGKGLGGSGNLNYLYNLYEGDFPDYGEWVEITKDPSWGYHSLQSYFKKVKEYMRKKSLSSNDENPMFRSTYKAVVRPSAQLKIQKYSLVHKVLVDDTGSARGVEYERFGIIKQAFASKEVIISGGVFASPKLLMLSGIGPKEILDQFNISAKANLPGVGKNFRDHLAIPLGPFFRIATQNKTSTNDTNPPHQQNMDVWNSKKVLRMPLINFNHNLYSREMSHFMGVREDILKSYMEDSQKSKASSGGGETMFINIALKKPISRGEVTIAGKDPKLYPSINPNYFRSRDGGDLFGYASDKQTMIETLEETVRFMETGANVIKAKFTNVSLPGCESQIFRGYGYWDCYIRHFSMSFNHGAGTCSMGVPVEDPVNTVVDPEMKVVGVRSLRVIDASIMPTLIGTYPFETVAVIGEKGADMIINKYKQASQNNLLELRHDKDDSAEAAFGNFRIKKLSTPVQSARNRPTPFQSSNSWQKSDQIIYQAATHHVGSTLSEDDLLPPGEVTQKPNPSYFPVKPLAAKLIFHPLIPEPQEPLTLEGTPILQRKI